ncbi:hypothetical protein HKD37_02G005655 [Glycine soja]
MTLWIVGFGDPIEGGKLVTVCDSKDTAHGNDEGEGENHVRSSIKLEFELLSSSYAAIFWADDYYGVKRVDGITLHIKVQAIEVGNGKWHGSVGGIVCAPIEKVWTLVSKTKRLPEWMPMVERCSSLADDDEPGYVRLVLGFMFPQQDGERSWNKERLVAVAWIQLIQGKGYPIPDGYGDETINSNPSDIGYGYGDMLRSRDKGLKRQYPYPTHPITMSMSIS